MATKKPLKKLYCYVDETGQDTKGKLFLVVVVLEEQRQLVFLQDKLVKIEKLTRKKVLKWTKTPFTIRERYLLELIMVKELKGTIFYSIYHETKEYVKLTSLTIAKAIFTKREQDYAVNIVIDGLNKKEMEKVREELKKLTIRYNKIRGMKDEQSVFLRLADAIAGFLRDCVEKQLYTKSILRKFEEQEIVSEA